MSAYLDKSQRITFVYTNLHAAYMKAKGPSPLQKNMSDLQQAHNKLKTLLQELQDLAKKKKKQ